MRFGLLSTAEIAVRAFIPAIRATDHELLAVASRDQGRAETFASEHTINRAYGSYEALLEDEDIEAIYNPLPNSLHAEWTAEAADHGLHVLCEKPLGVDATESREMGDYCDDREVTLMEAFMYRYHPRTQRAVELADTFDDIRSVTASFHWPLAEPSNIRFDPDLGGGSLLDVGSYAVTAVRGFLGMPDRVYGVAADTLDSGVDTAFTGLLEYPGGVTGRISAGYDSPRHERYRVEAKDGWLAVGSDVDFAFLPGETETALHYSQGEQTKTDTFEPVDQYALEIEHFVECVETGRPPATDADYAVATMEILDALTESATRGEPVTL